MISTLKIFEKLETNDPTDSIVLYSNLHMHLLKYMKLLFPQQA
jgi:hypothetical protein